MLKYFILQIFAVLLLAGFAFAQAPPPYPNPDNVDFVDEFNLSTGTDREFRELIQRVRERISRGNARLHDVPVCNPQVHPTINFFDIVLQIDENRNNAVRLRFETDNAWFLGYRDENGGQWTEIRNNDNNILIPGSSKTGFQGSYVALQRTGLQGRKEKVLERQSIQLSRETLAQSARDLQRNNEDRTNTVRSRAIIIIIEMIPEALRFVRGENEAVAVLRDQAAPANPSGLLVYLTTEWQTFCGEVARVGPNEEDLDQPHILELDPEYNLFTVRDLRNELALAIAFIPDTEDEGNDNKGNDNKGKKDELRLRHREERWAALSRRSERSDLAAREIKTTKRQTNSLVLPGRPLLEIYNMVINDAPGSIVGTLTVEDGRYVQTPTGYFYNRGPDGQPGPERIKDGGLATLFTTSRAISAADDIIVSVNLKLQSVTENPLAVSEPLVAMNTQVKGPDLLVANDVLLLNGNFEEHWDKIQTWTPESSKVQIFYNMMSNAAEALIEVILISGGDGSKAQIFGKIEARTNKDTDSIATIMLFNKSEGDHPDIQTGENVPLLRRGVCVPMDTQLRVYAELLDYSSHSPVATGPIEFSPKVRQTQSVSQNIKGDKGEIEVRVTWK